MTTLTHKHNPFTPAISTTVHDYDTAEQYTFCQDCEQNIDRFCFYDDDRGIVWTKWTVTN